MQKELLKKEIKKNYAKIALERLHLMFVVFHHKKSVAMIQMIFLRNESSNIGYNASELNSIPEKSILGLRYGTSLYFADCQYIG